MTKEKPFYWGGRWTTRAELKAEHDAEWAKMSKAEQVAFDNLPYSSIPELSEAQGLIVEVRPHLYRELALDLLSKASGSGPRPAAYALVGSDLLALADELEAANRG